MAWDTGTGLPSPYMAAIEEIASYFDRRPGITIPQLDAQTLQEKASLLASVLNTVDRES